MYYEKSLNKLGGRSMNLSILVTDFLDKQGILKTYRFVPINQYNKVVVDKFTNICADIRGNTDKDIGLLRVYNSDKCQLNTTTCKINDFEIDNMGRIAFCFEHMYIPVESSNTGSCGIYNFVLPVGFKLIELHIVDPFDNGKKAYKERKHFNYQVFYDNESKIQIVQMQLRSRRGSFSFILNGKADVDGSNNSFIEYQEQKIYLDDDIIEPFLDEGVKKSFLKNLKESVLIEPNFYGIGIDIKKLFHK